MWIWIEIWIWKSGGFGHVNGVSSDGLREIILQLLRQRGPGKTICPSEVARVADPGNWSPLMPVVRETAARLVAENHLVVTQRGQSVDPRTARGPIRLGLPPV